jgi:GNAT superfamily N-acetyltransferase
VEVAAMVDCFAAAPPQFGFTAERVDGATCLRAAGIPSRELNRVHGPIADVPAVLAHYDGGMHIVCGDHAGLAEHGYTPGYAWMKFAREADPAASAPTDLTLEQVGAQGGLDFARPVRVAFGMPERMEAWLRAIPGRPGWTCVVAYDGEQAVGSGALFVAGEHAWCGLGATLPEARGRGAQSAILAARIALAARQGARTVSTETGVRQEGRPDQSYRNLLRAGFAEQYPRPNWNSPTLK